MTAKKTTWRSKKKKKSTAEDLLKLDDDTSESEVALDSLGQFFNTCLTFHLVLLVYRPNLISGKPNMTTKLPRKREPPP